MSSTISINFDKMKVNGFSISSFCKENSMDRQMVYKLEGRKYLSGKKSKNLFLRLQAMGMASWEAPQNERNA